jgi:hypothetical protein
MDDAHIPENPKGTRATINRPEVESRKRAAFKRIANPRLENALHALDLLALTSDSTRYEFNNADVEIIAVELRAKVEETIAKFERRNPRPVVRFTRAPRE